MEKNLDNEFDPEEKLFRAVRPSYFKDIFFEEGKVSSAAFKDKNGLSVDRQGGRDAKLSVNSMRKKFEGEILSVFAIQCMELKIYIKYSPSKHNRYHTELHGDKDSILLNDKQAKQLARIAVRET